ncbi:GAF domain-containing protein [Sphingobacterium sp. N143]|uniref:ATP-binding protein n=1 Tax=Sphingobacterium sp. N143 TaxID=2746727 RepID=UPI002575EEB5|nr:ATP-binding protein [Sphingobacterium sp. N143]MDM1293357.1 GAF domain-containing protein [Sphingobacterium sp. N143]
MRELECHEEKIHLCGKIQNIGYLFVFDKTGCIATSENIEHILGIKADQAFRLSIKRILELLSTKFQSPDLLSIVPSDLSDESQREVHFIQTGDKKYSLSLYVQGQHIFIEIEQCEMTRLGEDGRYLNTEYLKIFGNCPWQSLTEVIKKTIEFDRVMVYRFNEDNSGQVIAECISEDMAPLLGFHYPEFDIPAQARRLYTEFPSRHVADIHAPAIKIRGIGREDLDLSKCGIRALSPIHLQYLKNAGVNASASFSVIVEGKLWGLVACQHRVARNIDLVQRNLCIFLTQYTVNHFLTQQHKEELKIQSAVSDIEKELKSELLVNNDLYGAFEKFVPSLLAYTAADGITVVHDRGRQTWGNTPNDACFNEIETKLRDTADNDFFCTTNFKYENAMLSSNDDRYPGIMRLCILPSNNWYIYLFRKEYIHEKIWAGKPEKFVEIDGKNGNKYPSPRTSFQAWREIMRGSSIRWKDAEIDFVKKIVQAAQQALAKRSGEIALLNKELVKSNAALDTFGHTLTHDLKNPLSVIQLAAQMLVLHQDASKLKLEKLGKNIIDATTLIREMLDKIYQLSQSNYVALKQELIDPRAKILTIIESCKTQYSVENLTYELGPTLPILGERTLLYQLFLNLIGNAIKYSSNKPNPKIEIFCKKYNGLVQYYIKDNGIGMNSEEIHNIFEIFKRLPNSQGFEGTGIGLSIVKRIADRLGAKISVESDLNKGTTFCVAFKSTYG